jgi:hypothetical protein
MSVGDESAPVLDQPLNRLAVGHGASAAATPSFLKTQREAHMKLSAPKRITWWIAVVVGVVGILSSLLSIPALVGFAFWLVAIGFALLAIATAVEGL